MNEQDQFLKDLEPKDSKLMDLFEAPINGEAATKTDTKVEDKDAATINDEDNREALRAKKALREERKASAFVANKLAETTERLERLNDAKNSSQGSDSEYLKSLERIYGNDSPEAVAATELLKNALQGVQKKATEDAIDLFRKEQKEASKVDQDEDDTLDTMLEDLEDDYSVDLTSTKSEELRKAFFKKLEKVSPKDKNGNILHYADHRAVWEDFSSQLQKRTDNTRAKDIASRSMQTSTTAETKSTMTAEEKWLKENGII